MLGVAAAFLNLSCDRGLGPIYEETGFAGTIYYSNWPSIDKVWELRLVAFVDVPSDSSTLFQLVLSAAQTPGHVVMFPQLGTPALPKFAPSTPYKLTTAGSKLLVDTYRYIVVAWRSSSDLTDWKPAGVYTFDPTTFAPEAVTVRNRRLLENIDIYVDFNHLPPKPWR